MMTCPCKGCEAPKRHPGCHSHCEAYLAWKEFNDQCREASRLEALRYADYVKSLRQINPTRIKRRKY